MIKEMRTDKYAVKIMENGYVHLYGNPPKKLRDAVNEIDTAIPRPSYSMIVSCLKEFFNN